MPGFGEAFSPAQVGALAQQVLSFGGKGKPNAVGAQLFADNCAACHGPAGAGDRALGAPALNDAIWLYGGTQQDIVRQISARSEEHTSELQSLMRISYAVFCLKKKKKKNNR